MDRRAAHPGVFDAARSALRRLPGERVRILEIGGGAGGAFRRWMALAAPFARVELTATDRDPELLAAYREEARSWTSGGRSVALRLVEADAPGDFARWPPGGFEAVVAQSFWDLVPPGTAAPLARRLLVPGGVFLAALTFSGTTRFDPPLGEPDRLVLDRYHASMTNPRAGTLLAEEFRADPTFAELAAGDSDWGVVPGERGYPDDEAFFLETLLAFVEREVGGAAERWLAARRRQLREGRLRFFASQRDLAAQRDEAVELAP